LLVGTFELGVAGRGLRPRAELGHAADDVGMRERLHQAVARVDAREHEDRRVLARGGHLRTKLGRRRGRIDVEVEQHQFELAGRRAWQERGTDGLSRREVGDRERLRDVLQGRCVSRDDGCAPHRAKTAGRHACHRPILAHWRVEMKARIRIRMGSNYAHYAGSLVDGAKMLELFGDVATELCIRADGDEGLFLAYDAVEFLAPVRAGDFIEAEGTITRWGKTSLGMEFVA